MDTMIGPDARPREDAGGATLAIGCFASICRDRLGDRLVAFTRAWPSVDVGVLEMPRGELLAGARDGTLALSVLPGGPREDLASTLLWRDRTMVAMPAPHPLAALPSVPVGALLRERLLIARERDGGELHRYLAHQIAPLVQLNGVLCHGGAASLFDQVAAGDGVALTCESQHLLERDGVVVRPVAAAGARFPVSAYWRARTPQWPLTALIAELGGGG